ncbi:hypothetical protein QBC34DRAFT_381271 [Podospora aff. communis PSN243]|uniref:C3H1-type domain-containing protein n=1 Tax=Podospora aff. communis PSN243 TaxID=3040156 RepID=A0AAV9GJM1_9PEZI|nr:hypothetical protein QBC34DRAFT_381271 [Podospora aff. communis PSN243]
MEVSGDLSLEKFLTQAEQNLGWMKAFFDQVSTLSQLYRDACRDLERERIAGRHAQEHAEKVDQKIRALEESTARSAFVLVLIDADADAYLFDDKYYRDDPADGGERAAVDLRAAVRQHLQSIGGGLAGLPIMVKAFASGEGLAYLLSKAGIASQGQSQEVVSRFTRGFSQADDMFDFVLVGKGKDRADHKLMAAFRQFAESPSCRRILLAGCHDNGYVRMLEKYVLSNSSATEKVTLLKSFQTGSEYAALPFASTTMETIFRNRRLSIGGGQPSTPILTSQYSTTATNGSPMTSTIPPLSRTDSSLSSYEPSTPGTPTVTTAQAIVRNTPPATYATRAAVSASPPPPLSRPLPMFGTLGSNIILVNADDQRIDFPLPQKSASAVEKLHQKTHIGGKRYCNMFHLYGACSGCNYLHDPISAAEKIVLRHRLRNERCHDRSKCRDPMCFYGHHCSCPMSKKCHFPGNMHNVDVSTWREVAVVVNT